MRSSKRIALIYGQSCTHVTTEGSDINPVLSLGRKEQSIFPVTLFFAFSLVNDAEYN
jgi:hypothetical protein